jgi:hypothetical protein
MVWFERLVNSQKVIHDLGVGSIRPDDRPIGRELEARGLLVKRQVFLGCANPVATAPGSVFALRA